MESVSNDKSRLLPLNMTISVALEVILDLFGPTELAQQRTKTAENKKEQSSVMIYGEPIHRRLTRPVLLQY